MGIRKKKQQNGTIFTIIICYHSHLESSLALPGLYLAIAVSLPQASLLRVVEPFDPDHHAGAPRLPEALHSAHIGQLGPTG